MKNNTATVSETFIHNITQLYSVQVERVLTPTAIEEISEAVRTAHGRICIGGGRFSMGGQVATEDSLHIDMRRLNKVLHFLPEAKTIRVQAGIRWRDIQEHIDPHNLSLKIMQSYCNFTVGGSLSVNVHGRYVGLGPLILSIRAIRLVLADGSVVDASPAENKDIFYAAIGGYGGIGVIVEAELALADNVKMERQQVKLPVHEYARYFAENIRNSDKAIFHNADLYPPHYTAARAVTWVKSERPVTVAPRLKDHNRSYALQRLFTWGISELPFGKWRREYIIDPVLYLSKPVVWRNYEASYDVAELEPSSRTKSTYVLQEYFVPVTQFEAFTLRMAEILQRYNVNMMNISVRHAHPDSGSLLAWARTEVFAFVLYYKQGTSDLNKQKVGLWTRELIDAALAFEGAYYLPYQLHATPAQFHKAYPRANEYFAIERKLDPEYKFRNKLWDKYMPDTQPDVPQSVTNTSDFHTIYSDVQWRDRFYLFLQNVYHIYPEDKFHALIIEACEKQQTDEAIYHHIQKMLPSIKPAISEIRYAIPALIKQKKVMAEQTIALLGKGKSINGYVEIGTTGRYVNALRKGLNMQEPIYLINDQEPSNSPADIAERGQLKKIGKFVPMDDYSAIPREAIPDASVDLVTCYIGLHHAPLDKLDGFVRSIARILRPGGSLIVRDHEVDSPQMRAFVALAHTVFNAGLGVKWETNAQELRYFTSTAQLTTYLSERGFKPTGKKLLQDNDPSINTLMQFVRIV